MIINCLIYLHNSYEVCHYFIFERVLSSKILERLISIKVRETFLAFFSWLESSGIEQNLKRLIGEEHWEDFQHQLDEYVGSSESICFETKLTAWMVHTCSIISLISFLRISWHSLCLFILNYWWMWGKVCTLALSSALKCQYIESREQSTCEWSAAPQWRKRKRIKPLIRLRPSGLLNHLIII